MATTYHNEPATRRDTTNRHVLLIGSGYVGTALACELSHRSLSYTAVVASQRSKKRLSNVGISAIELDLDVVADETPLPSATEVVYFVPPNIDTDDDARLTNLLTLLPPEISTVLYVSTSGVYGNHNGALVDETTVPNPQSKRARRRLHAEQLVRQYSEQRGLNWLVARVPGIYGPGRLPLTSIANAQPVIRLTEAAPGNRIHRDDLAYMLAQLLDLAAAAEPGHCRDIYNMSDNCHMSSTEFALHVARLAKLPPPPQISRKDMQATASPMRWSFLSESRCLNSSKIQQVLDKPLRFSDPIEGIRASLSEGEDPAA